MKAIQYRSYGDYNENRHVDLPPPQIADGEVLVEMRTVGINPLDNTFRSGNYYMATPQNLPRIGGQTGSGVIVETRSDAFKTGDRVFVRGPASASSPTVPGANWWLRQRQALRSSPTPSTTITPRPISPAQDI